jgi:hypothetical protein
MTRTIVVCGWEKFQHYKDRDPPWIKLYRDLLSSESWVLGTDHSRLVQIASTLLAARYQNATPLNYNLFRKVASLDLTEKQFKEALAHLAATGFLEIQGVADSASTVLATCTSEAEKRQSRVEQSREDPDVPQERDDGVSRVFDHWKQVHSHPRAQLDAKRERLIRERLKTYPEADLCLCISGYKNSSHHMGQNAKATVYDDLELFLRDAAHIDAGIKFASDPPRTDLSTTTRRNVAAIADWIPPEARNATG